MRRLGGARGMNDSRRGMTLMELMLVLTIIAVVGAFVLPVLKGPLTNQRLRKAGDAVRAEWNRTRVRLIEQTRDALTRNLFPIFVAEGTSDEKLQRIRHSDYLAKAFRSFQEIQNVLFIHGHSLAPNDEHFLKLIERGKLKHIFVGLHGKPTSDGSKEIIRRAKKMKDNRSCRL